jgi:hypothetical protein
MVGTVTGYEGVVWVCECKGRQTRQARPNNMRERANRCECTDENGSMVMIVTNDERR